MPVEILRPQAVVVARVANRRLALLDRLAPLLRAGPLVHDPRREQRSGRAPHELVRRVADVLAHTLQQRRRVLVVAREEPGGEQDAALAAEERRPFLLRKLDLGDEVRLAAERASEASAASAGRSTPRRARAAARVQRRVRRRPRRRRGLFSGSAADQPSHSWAGQRSPGRTPPRRRRRRPRLRRAPTPRSSRARSAAHAHPPGTARGEPTPSAAARAGRDAPGRYSWSTYSTSIRFVLNRAPSCAIELRIRVTQRARSS